jgi:RNA polymerase sigma factor (sigma-70 family)
MKYFDDQSDNELIENIKNQSNVEESLNKLVERHSGIYIDMVNAYSSRDNCLVDKDELINDKEYKIYAAALRYDSNKGAKFSTYLGNETKWSCLNTYNRNKRRPIFNSEFIENLSEEEPEGTNDIYDSIKKDIFNKVLNIIDKHPDNRVEKIFNMRYIEGKKNKVMPWKYIGDSLNLSIQGCINIHNSAIRDIQDELKGEFNFE